MVYYLCKVKFKTFLYPQTSASDAKLLNWLEVYFSVKGGFHVLYMLWIETLISAVSEETRRGYLFNT